MYMYSWVNTLIDTGTSTCSEKHRGSRRIHVATRSSHLESCRARRPTNRRLRRRRHPNLGWTSEISSPVHRPWSHCMIWSSMATEKRLKKHKTKKTVLTMATIPVAGPGENKAKTSQGEGVVMPGYSTMTFTILKDAECSTRDGPSIGLALMELPATISAPARLIVINTGAEGLAAQAGLKIRDQLVSIAGHDVATELQNSKTRVNALLVALGGVNDLEFVVLRKQSAKINQSSDKSAPVFSCRATKSTRDSPVGGETAASVDGASPR